MSRSTPTDHLEPDFEPDPFDGYSESGLDDEADRAAGHWEDNLP